MFLVFFDLALIQKEFDLNHITQPLVVRFFSHHRPRSVLLDQDWLRFEQMYINSSSVHTTDINCGKRLRLCLKENVWDPPAIRMYMNNTVYQYDGGMSYQSIAAWVYSLTRIPGRDLDLDLLSPNNRTFHDLLEKQRCVFVMFYKMKCKECDTYMSSLTELARELRPNNVSICEINIDKFKSFDFDYQIRSIVAFRLFAGQEVYEYKQKPNKRDMKEFITNHCI